MGDNSFGENTGPCTVSGVRRRLRLPENSYKYTTYFRGLPHFLIGKVRKTVHFRGREKKIKIDLQLTGNAVTIWRLTKGGLSARLFHLTCLSWKKEIH
jgi:hypothetical protein